MSELATKLEYTLRLFGFIILDVIKFVGITTTMRFQWFSSVYYKRDYGRNSREPKGSERHENL